MFRASCSCKEAKTKGDNGINVGGLRKIFEKAKLLNDENPLDWSIFEDEATRVYEKHRETEETKETEKARKDHEENNPRKRGRSPHKEVHSKKRNLPTKRAMFLKPSRTRLVLLKTLALLMA